MDRREPNSPQPRFVLFTPPPGETDFAALPLAELRREADIAAVILRAGTANDRELVSAARKLLPLAQEAGAALLLENHASLVAEASADGAHLTDPEIFQAALPLLKPGRIAGAAGLASRHDSMTAGEAGADYVLFGEPNRERRPSLDAIIERVEWWAEIFAVPCVAYAARLDEIAALVRAGADFIALEDAVWKSAEGPATAMRRAAEQIQLERAG